MKRITAIFLVLSLLFLLGCSGNEVLQENESTTGESSTESSVVRVTFPEGLTAVQIAEKLEKNKVCSASDFMKAVCDIAAVKDRYSFASKIENTDKKAFALEGYVFPDTYDFYKGESAASALSRFLSNTEKKLTSEMYDRAGELGFSMDEIITLASIIQEEAGDPKEMGKVSSVLHNRIKSPDYGRLQCDVTINYVNLFITNSPYLKKDTAHFAELYNTYKVMGLPVGAICCPGLDAIKAALYPEDTSYFFFVTDSDMNYYYSSTYAEHLENCKKCGL